MVVLHRTTRILGRFLNFLGIPKFGQYSLPSCVKGDEVCASKVSVV